MIYLSMGRFFIYPANSVTGGPIEPRTVVHDDGKRVLYDKKDQYGFIGANKSIVFKTKSAAERRKAKDEDLSD